MTAVQIYQYRPLYGPNSCPTIDMYFYPFNTLMGHYNFYCLAGDLRQIKEDW